MKILLEPYLAIFLIIFFAYIIGNIKIRGLSLDTSAVLFVSIVFGYFGLTIPDDFKNIGLVIFIFIIGFQAGPSFFESFKSEGRKMLILALIIVITGSIATVICSLIFNFQADTAGGLLVGSLTSTPGLAAIVEISKSKASTIAYGITYPFGVIGVVIFIKLLPKLMRTNIEQAENDFNKKTDCKHAKLLEKSFEVENERVIGKTIKEIHSRERLHVNITRISYNNIVSVADAETVLFKGAIINAIGTEETLQQFENIVGKITNQQLLLNDNYQTSTIVVTNKNIITKTLAELQLQSNFHVLVTQIKRGEVELEAESSIKLKFGDKLQVVGIKSDVKKASSFIGNDYHKLNSISFLPISLGIVLGILLGKLHLKFLGIDLSLGLTGGVMILAILMGRFQNIGKVTFTIKPNTAEVLKQIGLILFLISVGTEAGAELVSALKKEGFSILVSGAIITLVPMIVASLLAKYLFKIDILYLLGTIAGGMTSTPGLGAANSTTTTQAPSIAYASVYPFAMILTVICVQLIYLIV